MPKLLTSDGLKNDIGPRVRDLREKWGLSQEALMAQLQLRGFDGERGIIKRIENGSRYVSELELRILVQYFGVSYDYLLDGKEESK